MVTPYLLLPGNGPFISLVNPWTLAGGLTLAVSHRTRSLFLSVVCGFALFMVLGGVG